MSRTVVIRVVGFWFLLLGAAVAAMDPTLVPAASLIGKGSFALGLGLAASPGVRFLIQRTRGGHLLVPALLALWLLLSASVVGGIGPFVAAVEVSAPIVAMLLIAVQRWGKLHVQAVSISGACVCLAVAFTGLAGFDARLNQGLFGHPNGFGGTLLVLSFFPVLALLRSSWTGRLLGLVALMAAYGMLVTTSSRGSLLASLVFLGLTLYLRSGRMARAGLVCSAVAAAVLSLTVLSSFGSRELEAISFDLFGKRIDTGRLAMWGVLVQMALVRPVFGYGPGGSFAEFNDGLSAHSVYLQVLFDAGLPALLLLLVSVSLILRAVYRGYRLSPSDPVLSAGLAFLVAMVFHGLIEVSWLGNFLPGTFIFWPVAGFVISRAEAVRAGYR